MFNSLLRFFLLNIRRRGKTPLSEPEIQKELKKQRAEIEKLITNVNKSNKVIFLTLVLTVVAFPLDLLGYIKLFANDDVTNEEILEVLTEIKAISLKNYNASITLVNASPAAPSTSTSVETKPAGVELQLFSYDSTVSFEVGQQDFHGEATKWSLENAAARFIFELNKREDFRNKVHVFVEFEGSADAHGGIGPLSNPFRGNKSISIPNPIINGKKFETRHYHPGDKIYNEDLALIRAYRSFEAFRETYRLLEEAEFFVDQFRFSGVTSVEKGADHRYSRIKFQIFPKAQESST